MNEKSNRMDRRGFLLRGLGAAGTLLLGGCGEKLTQTPWVPKILDTAETVNRHVQNFVTPRRAMAREYNKADISRHFKANGTTHPDNPAYEALAANHFADWRLEVGGLVQHPGTFSLADLRAMPSRTQITRHDCVEGWSCIGQWTGVPLSAVLERVKPRSRARYAVFFCADALGRSGDRYYESIGFDDAYHPQTILAYDFNGQPLPIPHGAPLRLRVERQLGYKMPKYLMRMELVERFDRIAGGRGGYWEDRGYAWYAGI